MSGYLIAVALVAYAGSMACAYALGRLGGVRAEKRRAAHVRRMMQWDHWE